MAAVVRTKARPCAPAGYEVNDKGSVTEAVVAGDLLKNGAGGWSKLAAGATEADGIALQDYYAGQGNCSIGIQGEMDGFSGLVPGAPLYPSAAVAGGLDTTAAGVIRVKAATATRIRYNFV
jgi:hypothetical protein